MAPNNIIPASEFNPEKDILLGRGRGIMDNPANRQLVSLLSTVALEANFSKLQKKSECSKGGKNKADFIEGFYNFLSDNRFRFVEKKKDGNYEKLEFEPRLHHNKVYTKILHTARESDIKRFFDNKGGYDNFKESDEFRNISGLFNSFLDTDCGQKYLSGVEKVSSAPAPPSAPVPSETTAPVQPLIIQNIFNGDININIAQPQPDYASAAPPQPSYVERHSLTPSEICAANALMSLKKDAKIPTEKRKLDPEDFKASAVGRSDNSDSNKKPRTRQL